MNRLFLGIFTALLICAFVACENAPKVVQGTVLSFDSTSKTIVIKDECAPNPEIALSIAGAEIGAEPQAGDMVRAAYHEENGRLTATRLMNMSKQKEIGTLANQKTNKKCKP